MKKAVILLVYIMLLVGLFSCTPSFKSNLPEDITRMWIGPEYWANRLQDWKLEEGKIVCVETASLKPMRTIHLLPYSMGKMDKNFQMSVVTGLSEGGNTLSENTWTGFLIGAGGGEIDYRGAALVHHGAGKGGGIIAGVDGQGKLMFRDMTKKEYPMIPFKIITEAPIQLNTESNFLLRLKYFAGGKNKGLQLTLMDRNSKKLVGKIRLLEFTSETLTGNVALVSHPGNDDDKAGYWFKEWKISGSRLIENEDGLFGPILSCYYTVNDKILKMTAQFPVLGEKDPTLAILDKWDNESSSWNVVAEAQIEKPSYTALFRVTEWDDSRDTPYRVRYEGLIHQGNMVESIFEGIIPKDPVDKKTITVAAFTGNQNIAHHADSRRLKDAGRNSFDVGVTAIESKWTSNNVWFPHEELVGNVQKQKPDLLVFTGDQIYESNPTAAGFDNPYPDLLYKWYLWCWAYRDLSRNIPAICMPDDHDVYQGNLWGWSGKRTPGDYPVEGKWSPAYNDGGYWMPVDWIKMVERTQTAHLPDPYDPNPVEQGIGVYYTQLKWGGISFAILEDRKFKTPMPFIEPIEEKVDSLRAVHGAGFAPRINHIPEGQILGDRQLDFIRDWVTDWENVYMKAAISQTIFSATHTGGNINPGKPAKDHDSNGWPPSGRNQALEELRKGFAFMIGGDQHLATVIHHGIDEFNDAGYSFCVPSIANFWTRSWIPEVPGFNRDPELPEYTGEFFDAFGNRINIYAVANPKSHLDLTEEEIVRGRTELYRKASGYGIVKFDKSNRSITMECWPRYVDPDDPSTGEQYPDWPVTIHQDDNYGRIAAAYLPEFRFQGVENPVLKIIDQESGELVYSIRIAGNNFTPKIFKQGIYQVEIIDPESGKIRVLSDITLNIENPGKTITITF
ncbi:alkaline phosphatase D family protein [Bacteroidota bacterium]